MDDIRVPVPAGSTRFMDLLRVDMRARGYALPTERTYLQWIRRYITFNQLRHPAEMGQAEIENFLNHLAVARTVRPFHTTHGAECADGGNTLWQRLAFA